jgi:hypothetical protein
MKLSTVLLIFCFSVEALAWNYHEKKEFTLNYNFEGQTLQIKEPADSYLEALDSAATRCLIHFKKVSNYKHSEAEIEDKGRRIIDTCANPRSS